ncbi:hypothetical protein CGRA01v4_07267 [Colletotrichum graminicola]|nr:hypothetical protein CGRA01v4_07267 [Colletotrichum graminicola]
MNEGYQVNRQALISQAPNAKRLWVKLGGGRGDESGKVMWGIDERSWKRKKTWCLDCLTSSQFCQSLCKSSQAGRQADEGRGCVGWRRNKGSKNGTLAPRGARGNQAPAGVSHGR